jgi:DNA-binding NtrC family response regulator
MTGQPPVLLVVDDERSILDVVSRFAQRDGFEVAVCATGQEALNRLRVGPVDLALVDLRMPDLGGLDVLRSMRDIDPSCRVVLMTGYASIDTAVEAVKLGAMDYLSKPLDFQRLQGLFGGVREELEQRRSLMAIESEIVRRVEFHGMIGRSGVMQELFGMVRRLAPHVRSALIVGETGTGKELVARALHKLGPRADRRFISVNCSAMVEALFESELFGQTGGAGGAAEGRSGMFELADGGTLFLDEVADLPPSVQAKLLRVLELGEVNRLGATQGQRVDVQVISATHRDLRAEVAAGRFRSDLF